MILWSKKETTTNWASCLAAMMQNKDGNKLMNEAPFSLSPLIFTSWIHLWTKKLGISSNKTTTRNKERGSYLVWHLVYHLMTLLFVKMCKVIAALFFIVLFKEISQKTTVLHQPELGVQMPAVPPSVLPSCGAVAWVVRPLSWVERPAGWPCSPIRCDIYDRWCVSLARSDSVGAGLLGDGLPEKGHKSEN